MRSTTLASRRTILTKTLHENNLAHTAESLKVRRRIKFRAPLSPWKSLHLLKLSMRQQQIGPAPHNASGRRSSYFQRQNGTCGARQKGKRSNRNIDRQWRKIMTTFG